MSIINIAIDGPAGAGKSSIARAAAGQLGYLYVDTGALYRAVGLNALRAGLDMKDTAAIAASLPGLSVTLRFSAGEQRVFLNEEDVCEAIRSPEASMAASAVSAVPAVRDFLFELQQGIARENNCIMDGRDIGTVVLPNAQVKIFLTAAPEERARRRWLELQSKGTDVPFEEVLADLKQRDYNDENRAVAPLKPAADSVIVDTTGIDLQGSIDKVVQTINRKEITP